MEEGIMYIKNYAIFIAIEINIKRLSFGIKCSRIIIGVTLFGELSYLFEQAYNVVGAAASSGLVIVLLTSVKANKYDSKMSLLSMHLFLIFNNLYCQ